MKKIQYLLYIIYYKFTHEKGMTPACYCEWLDCKYKEKIENKTNKLKTKFKKITLQDKKLKKHFEDKKTRYEDIVVASAIVGGIDLRNVINNSKEKYPYNRKELKMIDKFYKLGLKIERG